MKIKEILQTEDKLTRYFNKWFSPSGNAKWSHLGPSTEVPNKFLEEVKLIQNKRHNAAGLNQLFIEEIFATNHTILISLSGQYISYLKTRE